jgi:hypothetical protein
MLGKPFREVFRIDHLRSAERRCEVANRPKTPGQAVLRAKRLLEYRLAPEPCRSVTDPKRTRGGFSSRTLQAGAASDLAESPAEYTRPSEKMPTAKFSGIGKNPDFARSLTIGRARAGISS